jgi:hypothetical protein
MIPVGEDTDQGGKMIPVGEDTDQGGKMIPFGGDTDHRGKKILMLCLSGVKDIRTAVLFCSLHSKSSGGN